MGTAPVKSQPLHNFSLPLLKWGAAKTHTTTTTNTTHRFRRPISALHSSTSSQNHKPHTLDTNGNGFDNDNNKNTNNNEEEEEEKPWKLRPRRAVSGSVGMGPVRPVQEYGSVERRQKTKKKRRLWIALSKDEIEEDVFVMTGSRPSRRPKKRSKNVQKQLDSVFPGLWLVGYTADVYKAADTTAKK